MPLRDLSIGLGVIVIWALNIIVIKVGVTDMPPLLLTTLRFALVALLLVPFHPVARHQLPFLALLSLTFGTLHFACCSSGSARPKRVPAPCWCRWARPSPPCWR